MKVKSYPQKIETESLPVLGGVSSKVDIYHESTYLKFSHSFESKINTV